MNWQSVLSVLSYLLIIVAFCLLAPLGIAIGYDSHHPNEGWEIAAFAITAALSLGLGLWLRRKYISDAEDIGRREGFAIVSFSWLAMVLLGMLPYLLSGTVTSVTDAFFETMSGFIQPRGVSPRVFLNWQPPASWVSKWTMTGYPSPRRPKRFANAIR